MLGVDDNAGGIDSDTHNVEVDVRESGFHLVLGCGGYRKMAYATKRCEA